MDGFSESFATKEAILVPTLWRRAWEREATERKTASFDTKDSILSTKNRRKIMKTKLLAPVALAVLAIPSIGGKVPYLFFFHLL